MRRFSLASLLLLITLAGVSISHWLTSHRLRNAETLVSKQRERIRELSHDLGLLTEEDLASVQVMVVQPPSHTLDTNRSLHREMEYHWLLHLPGHRRWRLAWATENIPTTGVPTKSSGSVDFTASERDWSPLDLYFGVDAASGWSLRINLGYIQRTISENLAADRSQWLEQGAYTQGGNMIPFLGELGPVIETFSAPDPVVVFRENQLSSGVPNGSGFMMWFENLDKTLLDSGSK